MRNVTRDVCATECILFEDPKYRGRECVAISYRVSYYYSTVKGHVEAFLCEQTAVMTLISCLHQKCYYQLEFYLYSRQGV